MVYDEPRTGAEVFAVAVASFDSAIALASGTDNQNVLINRAAKVGKGRALMALNQYAAAAQAVAGIPTSFTYAHTFSLTTSQNIVWNQGFSAKRYSVGDSIDGNNRDILVKNAIPFTSAKDPRVPVTDTKFVDARADDRAGRRHGHAPDAALRPPDGDRRGERHRCTTDRSREPAEEQ